MYYDTQRDQNDQGFLPSFCDPSVTENGFLQPLGTNPDNFLGHNVAEMNQVQ